MANDIIKKTDTAQPISFSDLNGALEIVAGTTRGFNTSAVSQLIGESQNGSERSLSQLKNASSFLVGQYYTAKGYISEAGGGVAGSMTRKNITNQSGGGWKFGGSDPSVQINNMYSGGTSQLFFRVKTKSGNSNIGSQTSYANWTKLVFEQGLGNQPYELARSNASWSSTSYNWYWGSGTGLYAIGSATNVRRYVRIE